MRNINAATECSCDNEGKKRGYRELHMNQLSFHIVNRAIISGSKWRKYTCDEGPNCSIMAALLSEAEPGNDWNIDPKIYLSKGMKVRS